MILQDRSPRSLWWLADLDAVFADCCCGNDVTKQCEFGLEHPLDERDAAHCLGTFDVDEDQDVDLRDAAEFQLALFN